tara:strand:+ start:251 stop:355 length:105 start_codon:yes stop_codon:yes gene_type:complete
MGEVMRSYITRDIISGWKLKGMIEEGIKIMKGLK